MLRQKLQDDQIIALKSGDKTKLEILRFILAQIKNKEIDKKSGLNDEETLVVIKKVTKELKESIEAFEKGGRKDLSDDSKKQLEIVSVYLPAEISDEELKQEVEKVIKENQTIFDNNLPAGRQAKSAIIGICMKQLRSKADPGRIMKTLQQFLSH